MARVKTAIITRKKHKKILKRAKGYYGAKHYRFRMAKQAVMKSGMYAYVGRKDKKSNFRKLWIARINAAARMNGTTYSKMIAGLKKANVTVNRKMLAEMAVSDPKAFAEVAEIAKKAEEKMLNLIDIKKTRKRFLICFLVFFIMQEKSTFIFTISGFFRIQQEKCPLKRPA